MNLQTRYKAFLEKAYERDGYRAIRYVGFYWMLGFLPMFLVDIHSVTGKILFWVVASVICCGVVGSGWFLWGVSIKRANERARKLEDEEWKRHNG